MKKRSPGVWFCRVIDFAACIIVLFLFLSLVICLNMDPASEDAFADSSDMDNDHTSTTATLLKNTNIADELRYIPHSTVQTWSERDYLIVFGIPSVDVDERRRRRYLQRSTCWQFPGVARKDNNFTGDMLVLYVLARHPSQGYNYSAALLKEVEAYHDIITLPMNEGRATTNKRIGTHGYWGMEAEIGMSRKTFFWFQTALKLFPNASFFSKGDDDIFLRVPQYLYQLQMLPRRGMYWGAIYAAKRRNLGGTMKYRFALGPCYTLSRDAVLQVVSYEPVQRLVHVPYSVDRVAEYIENYLNSEDMMVGFILRKTNFHNRLIYFMERRCSFHDVHEGVRVEPVKRSSMMIHHLWENEYAKFMRLFGNNTLPLRRIKRNIGQRRIEFYCR
ncbi:hypothetical protein LSM04_000488 [Trypanosoma melophagium]|uniref:uncharacterized protein n=1 Tax=Trypanosoma melophagium TaxID=715481 RepID=UPI003519F516|nr:hypothetical protein LSM04_000488 [Trypanosoma melophagium]